MKRIGPVFVFVGLAALAWVGVPQFSRAEDVLAFRVDPFWPKPLPNKGDATLYFVRTEDKEKG